MMEVSLDMAHPTLPVKRFLVFAHRWLGAALSMLFVLWFVSGIVMMYWTFPAVTMRIVWRAPHASTPSDSGHTRGRSRVRQARGVARPDSAHVVRWTAG